MNQSQKDLTTSCKGCCFADVEEGIQLGCLVRHMEEDSFHMVDGNRIFHRMCHFKRGWSWHTDKEMDEKIDLLDEEVKIHYNVFIETNDYFSQALHAFNDQTLQPDKIVGVGFDNQQVQKYYDMMNEANLKARWFHQEFLEVPADWRDNVMIQHKSQFYVFAKPPIVLSNDFFEMLSNRINYDDLRFGCIEEENMLIFPHGLYQLCLLPIREILSKIEELGLKRLSYEDIYTTV